MGIVEQKLSDAAVSVLGTVECDGVKLTIPGGTLDRALYEEVNECLTRLGGKWKGGRVKAHLFDNDPRPALSAVVATGYMPPDNPTAFFPTQRPQVDMLIRMVDLASRYRNLRILEPSAGTGAFADAIREMHGQLLGTFPNLEWTIDCCEILPMNRHVLTQKGHRLVGDDFLAYTPEEPYDVILMNPPFSVDGDRNAYRTHILHAWSMLSEEGILGAIAPRGWTHKNDKASMGFLDLVALYGGFEHIEAGAFKAAGTMVATSGLWMEKTNQDWRLAVHQGHFNWYVYAAHLHVDNERDSAEAIANACQLPAPERAAKVRQIYDEVALKAKREYGEAIILGDAEHSAILEHVEESYDVETAHPVVVIASKPATIQFTIDDFMGDAA